MTENIKEIALKACDIINEKLGTDIVCLDITHMTVIADYFVIASGRNPNHVKALLDEVEEKLAEAGYEASDKEGLNTCTWGLIDFQRVIIHVFSQEARVFYNLERIWSDGKKVAPEEL